MEISTIGLLFTTCMSLIHENTDLPDIYKFYYLQSCCPGLVPIFGSNLTDDRSKLPHHMD